MAGIGVTPTTARQRLILVTAALLGVVALVVISQLNGMLANSRVNGGVAGNINDLAVSVVPLQLPDDADVLAVVGSWRTYDTQVVQPRPELQYSSPVATANAVLRWDAFLLIPVYAIFVLTLLWWARSWPPPPPGQPVPRAITALGRWWVLFVVLGVGVLADELENVVQSRLIDQAWDGRPLDGVGWLVALGVVKWAALALVLAPFVVVGVRLLVPVLRPLLRTAWFAVALLVLLGVLVSTDQAGDIVRRWGPGQVMWSLLTTALLAVALGLSGSRAFQIGRTPVTVRAQGQPLTLRALGRAAGRLGLLAVVAVVFLLASRALDWRGLGLFAVLLLVTYLLSLPIRHFWENEQTVDVPTVQTAPMPLRQKFGAVLAAVVPFLVGIAVVRPSIVDVFATDDGSWLDRDMVRFLLGAAVAVGGSLVAATAVGFTIRWLAVGGRVRRWSLLAVLSVITLLPSALLYLRSTSATVAQGLGGVALVLVFLTALTLFAGGLYVVGDTALRSRWSREAILPPSVRLLGFERPPLVGAMVLWFVMASLIGPGSYHDVRLQRRSGVDVLDITLSDALTAWQARQPDAGVPDTARPMLVVAASGGGLRATYWTALVLDCLLERETDPATGDPCGVAATQDVINTRRARTFAMSGVSGGSLGLVTYDTHVEVDGTAAEPGWYEARLSDDFLAPTLAWWLYRDAPAALLRPSGGRDRAAALERAWEAPWRREGDALTEPFLTRQSRLQGPLLFLNGYTVEDGCRLNVAVVRTAAGRPIDQCAALDPGFAAATDLDATTDLAAFLCAEADVRRSTAALLSARFPYISPSGQLFACGPDESSPRAFVVDGGYRDASAASTIVELWPSVEPFLDQANRAGECIVPAFLQLDNDDDLLPPPGSDRQPSQAIVPIQGLERVPGGNADAARVAAQRLFTGPFGSQVTTASLGGVPLDSRWYRVAPQPHPGTTAPLSWVLSEQVREDLQRQLVYNADAIAGLRALLDAPTGSLTCEPGVQP